MISKLILIDVDAAIADAIVDNTTIFENIHPNYVTFFGFILNFAVMSTVNQGSDYYQMFACFVILRYLCDILDGKVARRYKKTSEFGGYLDSFSDLVYQEIVVATLLQPYMGDYIAIFISTLLTVTSILYAIRHECMSDHTHLKTSAGWLTFISNNSILLQSAYLIWGCI